MKIARAEFRDPVPIPGGGSNTTTYPKEGSMAFQNGILTWNKDGATPTLVPVANVKFMVPAEEKK